MIAVESGDQLSLPSGIDELEWGSPILTGLSEVAHPWRLNVHCIIAVRPDSPAGQSITSRMTCQRIEGSESSSHSMTSFLRSAAARLRASVVIRSLPLLR
jgi:hypothetical protein